ncbi:MAG: tRNA dihydrouridine synthase DusB, partial [Bacteroidia bacterium]|nr:tRNA dihydrouridine synthase DusB [Bacteroidia bacterium]
VCRIHLDKSIEWKGPRVGIFEMRRHYTNYFKGLDHFKEYRMRLVTTESIEEIHEILEQVRRKYSELLVA